VDPAVKKRRLQELIEAFREQQALQNQFEIGRLHLVGFLAAEQCSGTFRPPSLYHWEHHANISSFTKPGLQFRIPHDDQMAMATVWGTNYSVNLQSTCSLFFAALTGMSKYSTPSLNKRTKHQHRLTNMETNSSKALKTSCRLIS